MSSFPHRRPSSGKPTVRAWRHGARRQHRFALLTAPHGRTQIDPGQGRGLGTPAAARLMPGGGGGCDGLPAVARAYNLYHPYDPVAYRRARRAAPATRRAPPQTLSLRACSARCSRRSICRSAGLMAVTGQGAGSVRVRPGVEHQARSCHRQQTPRVTQDVGAMHAASAALPAFEACQASPPAAPILFKTGVLADRRNLAARVLAPVEALRSVTGRIEQLYLNLQDFQETPQII